MHSDDRRTYTYAARPAPRRTNGSGPHVAPSRDLGLDVTRNYSDEAGVRSKLARLLPDALAGEFTVLVVGRLDRLGRTIPSAPLVLAELDASGVSVYAVDRGGECPVTDRGALADILAAIRPWTCGGYVTR